MITNNTEIIYADLLNALSNKQYIYILYQTETVPNMEFHRFQTQPFAIPHIYKQPTAIAVAVSIFKFQNENTYRTD